jgi:hypothetical protein
MTCSLSASPARHDAQPALSRQVKLLERELGVDLLHRTTHEFELTEVRSVAEIVAGLTDGPCATAGSSYMDTLYAGRVFAAVQEETLS